MLEASDRVVKVYEKLIKIAENDLWEVIQACLQINYENL